MKICDAPGAVGKSIRCYCSSEMRMGATILLSMYLLTIKEKIIGSSMIVKTTKYFPFYMVCRFLNMPGTSVAIVK